MNNSQPETIFKTRQFTSSLSTYNRVDTEEKKKVCHVSVKVRLVQSSINYTITHVNISSSVCLSVGGWVWFGVGEYERGCLSVWSLGSGKDYSRACVFLLFVYLSLSLSRSRTQPALSEDEKKARKLQFEQFIHRQQQNLKTKDLSVKLMEKAISKTRPPDQTAHFIIITNLLLTPQRRRLSRSSLRSPCRSTKSASKATRRIS
jgi:hypothetical protein